MNNNKKIIQLCNEIESKATCISDNVSTSDNTTWVLSQEVVGLSQAIAELADMKPVTNGDKVREALRNVSDRTLAYMFNFCDIFDDDCPKCPLNGQHCEKTSPKVLYEWLQEEVSNNDT
jgi:hypothetical protein